ncbi:RNA-binding protein 28 [Galendromus occidentalis]|uniref:RNA-binding protein 28 n=1 Tax=Galendromus occidentalis TaxID=34638 RepID=A0AAJ7P9R1_9ACAR|nr:RNA-binding protein 28 [Galendromus occidentalis]
MKSFGKFGEIQSVNIPKKPDGKMRGFAFVQFNSTPHAMKAVKEMNMKDIKGRTVAVDFTVAKGKFEDVRRQEKPVPNAKKNSRSHGGIEGSVSGEDEDDDEESDEGDDVEESGDDQEEQPQRKNDRKRKKPKNGKSSEQRGGKDNSDDSDGSSSSEDDTGSDSSDDDEFEKKHLQKRLKKSAGQAKNLREDPDEKSDSEIEFGSDGEVRLVRRDQVKDKKRILGKKSSAPQKEQTQEESESDSSGDEEAMEVDGSDDDDQASGGEDNGDLLDDQDTAETAPKKKVKGKSDAGNKESGADSDSDWGHTPSEGSSDEEGTKDKDGDAEAAKRRAEMIKKEDLNRTVFLSNISFETTQKTLQEHMKKFGPYKFCLLCMDRILNRSKGTAFVKFEERADAEKCIASLRAGELTLDGKVLSASSAMKRDQLQQEISKKTETKKQPKDNRNLYLAREGFIRGGTAVAADCSEHDIRVRAKLEANKKKSLKNLHNFVSPTRLCIHNLPPTCDDRQLRRIFAAAVDRSAKITEARVMLNMKRLGPDGKGTSKGFGFVNFSKHEDALKALRHVNNNPEIFTDMMRPIVSFSIENKAALMVKERRLQHSREKLKELHQMKSDPVKSTEQRNVDYGKGERLSFEGLRAQADMKTLPRRVGEKVRADPSRRNHLMRLKRLAKKAKKQPEFKKKKEKRVRAPTKAQLKEKRQDKQLSDLINKRRNRLQKNSE